MNVKNLQESGLYVPYEDMSPDLVSEIRYRLMDAVMALIGGAIAVPREEYKRVCELADGASVTRAVYPASIKTSPEMAAFLNGYLIRYADWGDTYRRNRGIGGHPSDCVAALLSLCDRDDMSGKEIMELLNLAYQFYSAMQEGMFYKRQDIDYTTCLSLVVPVIAAVANKESPEKVQNALNLSAAGAAILEQVRPGDITNLKSGATAYACARGLWCQRLGKAIEAPGSIFEGKRGWYNAICSMDGEPQGRGMAAYDCVEVKNFACFNGAQPTVECAMKIHKQLGGSEKIKSVTLCITEVDYFVVVKPGQARYPQNQSEADHSAKYCAATALKLGALTPLHYFDEYLEDPELRRLMDATEVRLLTEEEAAALNNQDGACMVIVELEDGSQVTASVSRAVGIMRDLDSEERYSRFRSIVEGKRAMVEGAADVDLAELFELLYHIEEHSGSELVSTMQKALIKI